MHTFLPSPSAQSGVPYLRKRSRSPWFRLPAPSAVSGPWGPTLPKQRGSLLLLRQNCVGLSQVWLPCLGLNPSTSLPLQPHFPLLPQSVTPASIPYSSSFTGLTSKSGQVWPHGMEPVISMLSRRPCNQGELPPSYILGGSHFHPPGSKQGHSYLTCPWNQLKVIDVLNDHARG